jgi:cytolysin (calcineurin-like family phosphatase)
VRTLAKEGTTEAPVWPSDDELALTKDERSSRLESYTITWAYTLDGHRDELTRTFSRDTEFLGAPLGSKRLVRVHRYGAVELIGDAG